MTSALAKDSSTDSSLRRPLLSPPKKAVTERLRIDDMLQKYCGEFGPWQLRHFVLTSLAWALEAFHTMVMIFADQEPEWKCLEPDCDAASFCQLPPGSWTWSGGEATSTVVEWSLICEEKYKVGLVQALFFCGCMIDNLKV